MVFKLNFIELHSDEDRHTIKIYKILLKLVKYRNEACQTTFCISKWLTIRQWTWQILLTTGHISSGIWGLRSCEEDFQKSLTWETRGLCLLVGCLQLFEMFCVAFLFFQESRNRSSHPSPETCISWESKGRKTPWFPSAGLGENPLALHLVAGLETGSGDELSAW